MQVPSDVRISSPFCCAHFFCCCITYMQSFPQEDREQFYRALGDLKFSPNSKGGGGGGGVKFSKNFFFFFEGDKGQNLLKFVCLFEVKFNFSIENNYLRVV